MNRRTFAFSLALAAGQGHAVTHVIRPTGRVRELQRLFAVPSDAMMIGRRCLTAKILPMETEALWHALGVNDPQTRNDSLRVLFDTRRTVDLAAGQMVVVDGWLLAHAEAAACSLLARCE